MNELIVQYGEQIVKKLEGNLEALVLVGSFSRGEGKFWQNNGKLELMSDVEFWAVVKNKSKIIGKVIGEEKVTVGFTTRRCLPKLKPYIFTVETKKFGKVIWGNDRVLDYIPDYTYEDIDILDGFILLNNRIVEQLILLRKIEQGDTIYSYDFEKGYIQIVNSVLAFNNLYRSLYTDKKEEFLSLFPTVRYLKENAPKLLFRVEQAMDSIKKSDFRILSENEALSEWRELRENIKKIWLYEAHMLSKNNSYELEKMVKEIISLPDFKSRIKGWMKFFMKGEMRIHHLKYISTSSPQFLIYQNAVKAYFSNEIDIDKIGNTIQKWETLVK